VRIWDPCSTADRSAYARGVRNADIFATLLPMVRVRETTSWMSMCGSMPSAMHASPEVNQHVKYPGAAAWSQLWRWRRDACGAGDPYEKYVAHAQGGDPYGGNVICMQEYQAKKNPAAGPGWCVHVLDKGHWGPYVYAGCGKVRRGANAEGFERPIYMNTQTTSLRA
jgi:hypothetical protein